MMRAAMTALLVLGCGCQPHRVDTSSWTITPGLGVSNALTLGMTFRDVRDKGLSVRSSSFPPWRPWREPDIRQGVVPSLGIAFNAAYREDAGIDSISFYVRPTSNHPHARFMGSLSCGMTFSGDAVVTAAAIIGRYGRPKEIIDPSVKTCGVTLGIDHITVVSNLNWQRIYYPKDGIYFDCDLKDGTLNSITVFPRTRAEQGGGHVR